MEPDLYFYCPKCGREVAVHPDTVPTLRKGIRVVSNVCECGHVAKARFDDCTTERRTPAVEVPTGGMEGVITATTTGAATPPYPERYGLTMTQEHVRLIEKIERLEKENARLAMRDDTEEVLLSGLDVASPHDSGATVNGTFSTETRGDYATAPVYKCNSKECGGLSLESGLFEGLCACGASVTEVRDVSKDQYRRMCAQAATIAAQADQILRMTGEVARLRDLMLEALASKEAQCALHETERRAMVERDDEARAEVERLETKHTQLLIDVGLIERERDGAILDRDAARARIAALEAVIEALQQEFAARDLAFHASVRSIVRMVNAGLVLEDIADDVVVKEPKP